MIYYRSTYNKPRKFTDLEAIDDLGVGNSDVCPYLLELFEEPWGNLEDLCFKTDVFGVNMLATKCQWCSAKLQIKHDEG